MADTTHFRDGQLNASDEHRISESISLFESKLIINDGSNFWDDAQVSGSGTSSTWLHPDPSILLSVSDLTAGKRVRQTFMSMNSKPGKSHFILMPAVLGDSKTGITIQVGQFGCRAAAVSGLYFQQDAAGPSVNILSNTTGSPVVTQVRQAGWNQDRLDGSGISRLTFLPSVVQALFLDYTVTSGNICFGMVIDGRPRYVHAFNLMNTPGAAALSSLNLPLRYSIENDGSGPASSLKLFDSSIESEGGAKEIGFLRYASTNGIPLNAQTPGTVYAVLGLRIKAGSEGAVNKMRFMSILSQGNDNFEWIIKQSPEVDDSFPYNGVVNSSMEVARGVTANTVTGGTDLGGGLGSAQVSLAASIDQSRWMGFGILTPQQRDTLVLCVRPLSTNAAIQCGVTWRELV